MGAAIAFLLAVFGKKNTFSQRMHGR